MWTGLVQGTVAWYEQGALIGYEHAARRCRGTRMKGSAGR
jgi:hypothetical protein